jgi:hypothetical protein
MTGLGIIARPLTTVQRTALDAIVRFEGLPGEYLQVDWGEVRHMPFTRPELRDTTRYFLAARLKHHRYMVVQWTRDMELETLIRGLAGLRTDRCAVGRHLRQHTTGHDGA